MSCYNILPISGAVGYAIEGFTPGNYITLLSGLHLQS